MNPSPRAGRSGDRAPPVPPLIALEGVRLRLTSRAGPVNILNGIDLKVEEGETLAVTGPSGSGKSSLLMILAGLERPSGGAVRLAGIDLASLDEDGLARFRREWIGIVFQSFHLLTTMTALENVALPGELAGRAGPKAEARRLLEAVGLGHRLNHYPAELSGGEQQRVALARAFAAQPRLLLADEPTGNLDQTTGQAVIELLFALNQASRTTLVLVTHDPQLAGRCRRVVRLTDGRLAADGSAR